MNYYASFPPQSRYGRISRGYLFFSPIVNALLKTNGIRRSRTLDNLVIEGNAFVILSSCFFTQRRVERMNLGDGKLYHIGGGGCACIIAPDGRKLTENFDEE